MKLKFFQLIKFSIYRINHHLNQLPNNPQSNNITQAGKGHDPLKSITEKPKQRFGMNNVSPGLVTTSVNNAGQFINSLKKQNSINSKKINLVKKDKEVQIFVQLITIINYQIKSPTIIYTKMTIIIR